MKYISRRVGNTVVIDFIGDRKKLIVDMENSDYNFENFVDGSGDKKLIKLIDKFDMLNNSYMYKEITYSELILYNKKISFKYYIKIIEDILNKSDKYKMLNRILYLLGPLILYIFYNIGYFFLYGFYFSGESEKSVPLFWISVNPIPFNFKSIVFVGCIFLLLTLLQYIPLIKSFFIKSRKEGFGYVIITIVSVSITFIFCCQIFIGGLDFSKSNEWITLLFTITFLPFTTYYIIKFYQYTIIYSLKFIGVCLYTLFIMVIINNNGLIPENLTYMFIFISSVTFPSMITSLTLYIKQFASKKFNDKSIKYFIYISAYLILVFLLIVFADKGRRLIVGGRILFLSILVTLVKAKIPRIKKIIMYLQKKLGGENVNKEDSLKNVDKEGSLNVVLFYSGISISAILMILLLLVAIPDLTILFGRLVRYSITDVPIEKIYFTELGKGDKVNVVIGNVIAQKGSSYYISQYPKRTLLTVESNNIRRLACDDFIFANNFNNFNIDKNDLIEKYKIIFQENNLKLEQTELVNNIDEYSSDYSQEIFIYSDSTKEIYDWKMDFNINYELYDDGKVKSFKIEYKSSYNKDSNELKNEELKKEIDNIMINIKRITKDYFHLPTFNLERDSSYYTNGLMDYRLYKSEYLTNSLVEEYYFKPYNNN